MICILDENDFCKRHNRIHKGKEKEKCLTDSDEAEKYRELIGSKHSTIKKIASLISSATKQIVDGNPQTTDEQYKARLEICQKCIFFKDWKCEVCGCYLTLKARWATQDCPEGKWPKLNEGKSCGCSKKI